MKQIFYIFAKYKKEVNFQIFMFIYLLFKSLGSRQHNYEQTKSETRWSNYLCLNILAGEYE